MKKSILLISLLIVLAALISCGQQESVAPESTQSEPTSLPKQGTGDPHVLEMMHQINDQLAAAGSNLFVNEIQFFTIGGGRPSNRIFQQPFRWVPNDPRRSAQGEDITYIVDQTFQGTSSGVSANDTETEIDVALSTWNAEQALKNVSLVKRADPGVDISIYDEFFPTDLPFGDINPDEAAAGNPFLGDIVNVGWYPGGFFEVVGGPGSREDTDAKSEPDPPPISGILAFSVTFIFLNPDGSPSDINGDNYLDTALNEIYYNDTFGKAGEPEAEFPWVTGQLASPNIDIQTVALHENGHSLGVGHFAPPPAAVMNPVYAGPNIGPDPTDQAAMNTVWATWPNP